MSGKKLHLVDHYFTWQPASATDLSDGLPDTLMVPIVERLRSAGYTTLQSCQGHAGDKDTIGSDGTLWIVEGPHENTERFFQWVPFHRVQYVTYFHDDLAHWEYVWAWPDTERAIEALEAIYRLREVAE